MESKIERSIKDALKFKGPSTALEIQQMLALRNEFYTLSEITSALKQAHDKKAIKACDFPGAYKL